VNNVLSYSPQNRNMDPTKNTVFAGLPLVFLRSLPILTISFSGLRRIGFLVLDRKYRVRVARSLYLRHLDSAEHRLDLARKVIEELIQQFSIHLVVIDSVGARQKVFQGLNSITRVICETESAWRREISSHQVVNMLGGGDRYFALTELAACYPELSKFLDFGKKKFFRNRDHERELRPLVNAFLLGHAVRLELEHQVKSQ